MRYRKLTTALIATLALSTVSCRSSKTVSEAERRVQTAKRIVWTLPRCRNVFFEEKNVTQQTHNEAVHDTLIETVTLTLHDTIRETTTILVQTNETGDTTRLTTNRDREKITSRNRTSDHSHHLTQTETDSTTKENIQTTPISPIQPKSSIKPLSIAFIIGLLLFPLIKFFRRLKLFRRKNTKKSKEIL